MTNPTLSPLHGSPVKYRPMAAASMDTSVLGFWRLTGRSASGRVTNLLTFRGSPTQLSPFSTSDPFGDQAFTFTMPQVTPFDAPGAGDLDWMYKGALVTLEWLGDLPDDYQYGQVLFTAGPQGPVFAGFDPGFTWNGYIVSFNPNTSNGTTITCSGAAYQMDNYQAKPEYPQRPYPYEHAIARQFQAKPHLKLKAFQIVWPSTWSKTYTPPAAGTPTYLVPQLVSSGDFWTGLLTRSTGNWEAALTSYIQTLLAGMYTFSGRWTLDIDTARRPYLIHRPTLQLPVAGTFLIDPIGPGTVLDVTVDWSQTLDVVYAQGTALDGVAFSGMEVSSDGSTTYYEPAAALRQAFPTVSNAWLDRTRMPIEQMINMQAGINEAEAEQVAAYHLAQFSDPGVTGTITLGSDPTINGQPISRYLIRAGHTIHIPGLLGRPEGIVAHVTQTSADPGDSGTNTLTIDSKFRDALTVNEVKVRGRDALKVPRMLVGGQYQPPVPDQLVPWNYSKGSGYIPSGKARSCVELFQGMPNNVLFPWTSWLKQRPPSDKRWRDSYIKIPKPATGKGRTNSDYNWAHIAGGPIAGAKGIQVKAAQSATIRLLQIVACNPDGTVASVPFHVSFYWSSGVSIDSMPQILPTDVPNVPSVYNEGQFYPFSPSAWEKYLNSGVLVNPDDPNAQEQAGLIRPYGTYEQMAGYWPSSDPGRNQSFIDRIDAATGMLVDESTWSIDTTETSLQFDAYSKKANKTIKYAGDIFVMIYCDQQTEDVYFIGRMFRVEPGTGQ